MTAKTTGEGVEPSTEVLLTRSQAARRMRVSVSTVRRMEGDALDPVVIEGRHYFRADDVESVRPRTDGEIAARAFEAFSAGKNVVATVIELEQPPALIEDLYKSWQRLSGDLIVRELGGWKKIGRVFESLGYPCLTPYLVQQCLLVCATVDEAKARLKRAVHDQEPVRLRGFRGGCGGES